MKIPRPFQDHVLGWFTTESNRGNQILSWFRRVSKLKLCRWPSQPIIVQASIWNPTIDNFKDEIKNYQIHKLLDETNTTNEEILASFRRYSINLMKIWFLKIWLLTKATVMLVTLRCWWLTVGENFTMLVTELRSWWHLLDVGVRRWC